MRLLIGLLVVGLVLWFAWTPGRMLLFGGRATYADSPKGEWVGQFDLAGYDPKTMGDTPGPHKHAAIKFTLSVEDHFLDEYGGPGELWIAGEAQPRSIHIARFNVLPKDNNRVRFEMLTHPVLVYFIDGKYAPQKFEVTQDDINYLQIKGVLQRGTDAEYKQFCDQQRMAVAPEGVKH